MLIKAIAHITLHSISLIFPKSKNLWLFGAWFGEKFTDNTSYLFNETPTNKSIKKIWITKNKDLLKQLRDRNSPCAYAYSPIGIYYQLRAKVFFCTTNSKDFCFSTLSPRNTFFQLWHGLPIKKIGYDTIRPFSKKWFINLIRSSTTDRYSYVLSPSRDFDHIFMSAFRVPKSKIIESPYPRCDGLFQSKEKINEIKTKLGITTKLIIFYLPTHRAEGKKPEKINSLISDIKDIEETLADIDATIIIKPHFYESGNYKIESSERIKIVDELPADLYACLAASDALITDYSSISLDYAITGKPIFFFTPDLDDYVKNDRETYFALSEIATETYSTPLQLSTSITQALKFKTPYNPMLLTMPKASSASISKELQSIAEKLIYGPK